MTASHPPDPPPDERGGGNETWRPSPWLVAAALGIVAAGLAGWWLSAASTVQVVADTTTPAASAAAARAPTGAAPRVVPAPGDAASTAATPAARRIARVRPAGADQTPDITDFINDGETPTMAEVIARLHQAGVHGGLAAFNPPGTRPLLIGLAVPDDFVLPEGYVRHYQATDDGQRVEPILMFAPGFQLFDADHRPIPMPADRVVPPELAPPGLAVRRIAPPPPVAGP